MLALRKTTARDRRPLAIDRARALSLALHEEFSIPFSLHDGSTGEPLGDRDEVGATAATRPEWSPEILAIAAAGRPHVSLRDAGGFRLVLPIRRPDGSTVVAIGDLPALAGTAQAARLEQARLQKWLQAVQERLSSSSGPVIPSRNDQVHVEQLRPLLEASRELTDLLAGLANLGESSADQARILQRAASVVRAESLIWVPCQAEQEVAVAGDRRPSAAECRELARWLAACNDWEPSGYLILNEPPTRGAGDRFPRIVNLMALRGEGRDSGGCLIVLNKLEAAAPGRLDAAPGAPGDDPTAIIPFRRIEVALLKPFAALLGLQSRSSRRQCAVQDLFAGLIRSLTAAIDAKDPYTCGHSERVARVAVEVAREMGLSDDELGDIYLAGLLHDIGKIGIPDSVLGKRGKLTQAEFAQIAEHVLIGCRILEGFGGIAHLLPSVRSHHERFDGTGYPHGLKGEAIPLMARILAVADCFDAMDTARPYRAPLPRPEIEAILHAGRGTQWDGEVIDAFFRARDRIYGIHQRGIGDSVWFALHAPHRAFSPHFPSVERPAMT